MKEIFRAAFVIGRRDFTAIIFSKAFIFFLLGPLFPLLIGVAAGSLGGEIAKSVSQPVVGLYMEKADADRIMEARDLLAEQLGRRVPEMKYLGAPSYGGKFDPEFYLNDRHGGLTALLSGTVDRPVLTGTPGAVTDWQGQIALLGGMAANGQQIMLPQVETHVVQQSAGDVKEARLITAQIAQTTLFMLTMLLAGMVLSNLVEEKSNKIIEILAASIPMDSVFLGKLFAMLVMAFVGIVVWGSAGALVLNIWGPGLPNLPAPAIGWPVFIGLGIIYFALAYLMLGSLFLGIGAMAATVREVQTLSMPATMGQLMVFFLAMYSVTKMGQPVELFAAIFPLSSPFAMIARAAQTPVIWHHLIAILWQVGFAILILRVGVFLFKRNVMKSGKAGRPVDEGPRRLFGMIPLGRGSRP